MALARLVVLLMLIVVGFSNMSCLNAIPSTRIRGLMNEASFQLSTNRPHVESADHEKYEERKIEGRMEVDLEDYPGSGANNRHNPWP